jgi:hypothetical protein
MALLQSLDYWWKYSQYCEKIVFFLNKARTTKQNSSGRAISRLQ